ncbi:MAG: sigma-54-dependent Fis family transcriptional regulator [Deltaproteobacteria bacterium]|nr:sigma-54-dependent Fis family transcriptional regulator [Deltaproteobacteria bacterium]
MSGASRWIRTILRCDSSHPDLANVLDVIERLGGRPYRTNVLLRGEAGTGKEGLARALHALMHGSRAPFVEVHAVGRADRALAELFGAGSRPKKALVDRAEGGTLFFDEVADLPGEVQFRLAELLRARPGAQGGPTVVACTERDLGAMVQERRFRHDLYHRIARIVLALPPLRERPGDVRRTVIWIGNRVLGRHGDPRTLEVAGDRTGDATIAVTPGAIEALCAHSWPGNFRELEAVLERALLLYLGDGDELEASHVGRALGG